MSEIIIGDMPKIVIGDMSEITVFGSAITQPPCGSPGCIQTKDRCTTCSSAPFGLPAETTCISKVNSDLAFTGNISHLLNHDVIISYTSPSAYLTPKLAVRTRLTCVDVFEDSGWSDLPNGANSILGLADSSMSFVKSLESSYKIPFKTSIYKALVKAFVRKAQRKAVYPFRDCFSYKSFGGKSFLGKKTPVINFVLGGGAKWDIYGTNSLVMVNKTIMCLAFIDAGNDPRFPIEIGGYQMDNHLVEFDFEA
ncbi:probable aspartic proteinase GIP1 [Brassica napus]|uniref:probable aspartic proteinase GIP1 n=1 Tax=Brassica napus TaxID=3708 RepID=UPI00207901EE|nr:probable aspartic proteinase GIP1 [Brassica napus]